jgi:hypothetical protein
MSIREEKKCSEPFVSIVTSASPEIARTGCLAHNGTTNPPRKEEDPGQEEQRIRMLKPGYCIIMKKRSLKKKDERRGKSIETYQGIHLAGLELQEMTSWTRAAPPVLAIPGCRGKEFSKTVKTNLTVHFVVLEVSSFNLDPCFLHRLLNSLHHGR